MIAIGPLALGACDREMRDTRRQISAKLAHADLAESENIRSGVSIQ